MTITGVVFVCVFQECNIRW